MPANWYRPQYIEMNCVGDYADFVVNLTTGGTLMVPGSWEGRDRFGRKDLTGAASCGKFRADRRPDMRQPTLSHYAGHDEILRAIHAELTGDHWQFHSEALVAGCTERARYTDGGYMLHVVPGSRGADVRIYSGRKLINSLAVNDQFPAAGIAARVNENV